MPYIVHMSTAPFADPADRYPRQLSRHFEVPDLKVASRACAAYIAEHDIPEERWEPARIMGESGLVGTVAHSGDVLPPAGSPDRTPLYVETAGAFHLERSIVEVPGFGVVRITGATRSHVESVPGRTIVDGGACRFKAEIVRRDGQLVSVDRFVGVQMDDGKGRILPMSSLPELADAVQEAVKAWHETTRSRATR